MTQRWTEDEQDAPIERPLMWSNQVVKQMSINPDVLAEPAKLCVAGPCDGQMMRCPMGWVLVIVNAVDGVRAVAGPSNFVELSKSVGGYGGHYVREENRLTWVAPTESTNV